MFTDEHTIGDLLDWSSNRTARENVAELLVLKYYLMLQIALAVRTCVLIRVLRRFLRMLISFFPLLLEREAARVVGEYAAERLNAGERLLEAHAGTAASRLSEEKNSGIQFGKGHGKRAI